MNPEGDANQAPTLFSCELPRLRCLTEVLATDGRLPYWSLPRPLGVRGAPHTTPARLCALHREALAHPRSFSSFLTFHISSALFFLPLSIVTHGAAPSPFFVSVLRKGIVSKERSPSSQRSLKQRHVPALGPCSGLGS